MSPDQARHFTDTLLRKAQAEVSGYDSLADRTGNRIEGAFTMIRINCYTDTAEQHELATEKVDTALDVLSHFHAPIFRSDGSWANPAATLCAIRESIALLQSAEAIALRSLKTVPIAKRRTAEIALGAEVKSLITG